MDGNSCIWCTSKFSKKELRGDRKRYFQRESPIHQFVYKFLKSAGVEIDVDTQNRRICNDCFFITVQCKKSSPIVYWPLFESVCAKRWPQEEDDPPLTPGVTRNLKQQIKANVALMFHIKALLLAVDTSDDAPNLWPVWFGIMIRPFKL